jgi:large subunit ribosomal protein L4
MENQIVRYCTAQELSFPEIDYSPRLLALAIRVYKQNARQGTVSCKDRTALVSRSNKKPWKQKGTGRARSGTARSPIWRGGAVSHGPQPRVRVLSVNKKVNKGALQLVFAQKLADKKVISLDFIPTRSCADASLLLKNNNLSGKSIMLLYNIDDYETYYTFSNIKDISLISYDAVNPYILSRNEYIIGLKKDNTIFEGLIKSWLI